MKYRYRESHEMKDSGVEWLGMIPKAWEVSKFKYFFKFGMGETILKEDLNSEGIPIFSATEENKYFGYIKFSRVDLKKGDIVIPARGNSIGAVKLVTERSTCTQTTIYCKKNSKKIIEKFIYYYMQGKRKKLFYFDQTAIPQITIAQVSENSLINMKTTEQQKIADFLDKKCEEFDSVIAKKEMLINKLEEAKKSLISEVVTGKVKVIEKENGKYGIIKRETHEMKDSGVEWLGMIPKEWEKNSMRRVLKKIIQGDSPISPVNDTLYKVLKLSAIKEGKFYKDENKPIEEKSYQKKYQLEKGDFLVTRGNTPELVADSCIVQEDINEKIMISDLIYRLYFDKNKVLINYMLLCFQSYYFRTQIKLSARGTSLSMVKVSQEHIKNWLFLLPSLNEQHIISKYLDRKCESIDNFIKNNNKIIEKLKLAKQSLISETVTGKIEIL